MSMSYTAGVFFGAFVERDTILGKKLDKYVDRHGGSPAPTEVDGVEISMVGSQSSGDVWMTVVASSSARSFGHVDGDVIEPELLTENREWRTKIREFLEMIGASDLPVGWHFETSIW